jgi:hypothetical protein
MYERYSITRMKNAKCSPSLGGDGYENSLEFFLPCFFRTKEYSRSPSFEWCDAPDYAMGAQKQL